jgi:hypothetical protein
MFDLMIHHEEAFEVGQQDLQLLIALGSMDRQFLCKFAAYLSATFDALDSCPMELYEKCKNLPNQTLTSKEFYDICDYLVYCSITATKNNNEQIHMVYRFLYMFILALQKKQLKKHLLAPLANLLKYYQGVGTWAGKNHSTQRSMEYIAIMMEAIAVNRAVAI